MPKMHSTAGGAQPGRGRGLAASSPARGGGGGAGSAAQGDVRVEVASLPVFTPPLVPLSAVHARLAPSQCWDITNVNLPQGGWLMRRRVPSSRGGLPLPDVQLELLRVNAQSIGKLVCALTVIGICFVGNPPGVPGSMQPEERHGPIGSASRA